MVQLWRAFGGEVQSMLVLSGYAFALVALVVAGVPGLRRRPRPVLRILRAGGLLAWAVCVASVTLTGTGDVGRRSVSLVPFAEIVELMTNSVWWQVPFVQIGGNVAMFVPFGLLLAIHPRWGVGRSVLVGFVIVTAIETAQFALATGRVASVDDVILAVVGTLLGALLAKGAVRVVRWARPGSTEGNVGTLESAEAAASGT
ncbi:VanZ family protein [Demequina salsinemoris]|uniref:VanZ family protein n=1 Tax=Demequina salsinemoris TaxID=577470 RepID=UPI0007850C06|nr:VanZ family protein [Demequina salsinemoris]